MERIELRIPSTAEIDVDDLMKLLTQLKKLDFLFRLKIDCNVSVQ